METTRTRDLRWGRTSGGDAVADIVVLIVGWSYLGDNRAGAWRNPLEHGRIHCRDPACRVSTRVVRVGTGVGCGFWLDGRKAVGFQ